MKKQRSKKIIIASIATVVLLIGIYAGGLRYINRQMQTYCFKELENSAQSLSMDIQKMIKSDQSQLHTVAGIISNMDETDISGVEEILAAYSGGAAMHCLEILYPDNTMLASTGDKRDASDFLDFQTEAQEGTNISRKEPDIFKQNEYVIRNGVPVLRNGETIAMLYGVVYLSELPDLFQSKVYEGRAAEYLVEASTGDFLLDTWHKSLGNLKDMKERKMLKGYSFDRANEDMQNGRSGNLGFVSESTGDNFYIHYEPVGINDWYCFVGVPESVAFRQARGISIPLNIIIVVEAMILLVYLYFIISYIQSSVREKDRQLQQIHYMFDIQKVLFSVHRREGMMKNALQKVSSIMKAQRATLIIFENNVVKKIYNQDCCEENTALIEEFLQDRDWGKWMPLFQDETGKLKSYILKDVETLSENNPVEYEYLQKLHVKNMILQPITDINGNVTASLSVCNSEKEELDPEFLECVALSFSMAVHNIEAYTLIQKIGSQDQVTGLKNRNSFMSYIDKIKLEKHQSLACIYVDVDGLHEVNERHGHDAGDRMLKALADCMKGIFGEENCYRIGGDEFIALCRNLTSTQCNLMEKELRERGERAGYHISSGCEWRKSNFDLREMMNMADQKMLENKRHFYRTSGDRRRIRNEEQSKGGKRD